MVQFIIIGIIIPRAWKGDTDCSKTKLTLQLHPWDYFPSWCMIGSWGKLDFGKYSRGCSQTVSFVFEQRVSPFPAWGILHSSLGEAPFSNCAVNDGNGLGAAILVGWLTSSTEPGGFSPPAGDASADSWFRKNPVPRVWRVLFSNWTRFSRKKSCLFWVDRSPILASSSYLATLLRRKGDEAYFSPKLREI